MKDYYKILEIHFGAGIPEIKKAYRRLALMYHPDRNKAPNAAHQFIEVTEAYEVLRDSQKRADYDNIYKSYVVAKSATVYEKNSYQEKQQTWTAYGSQKAKEYSNMSYDNFSKRIIDEIKLGASYLPNIFTIGFVLIGGIAIFTLIPKAFNEGAGMGFLILLMIIGMGVLVYHLYKVMSVDYAEERRRKLKK